MVKRYPHLRGYRLKQTGPKEPNIMVWHVQDAPGASRFVEVEVPQGLYGDDRRKAMAAIEADLLKENKPKPKPKKVAKKKPAEVKPKAE